MKTLKKSIILLLALSMIMSMVCTSALAEEIVGNGAETQGVEPADEIVTTEGGTENPAEGETKTSTESGTENPTEGEAKTSTESGSENPAEGETKTSTEGEAENPTEGEPAAEPVTDEDKAEGLDEDETKTPTEDETANSDPDPYESAPLIETKNSTFKITMTFRPKTTEDACPVTGVDTLPAGFTVAYAVANSDYPSFTLTDTLGREAAEVGADRNGNLQLTWTVTAPLPATGDNTLTVYGSNAAVSGYDVELQKGTVDADGAYSVSLGKVTAGTPTTLFVRFNYKSAEPVQPSNPTPVCDGEWELWVKQDIVNYKGVLITPDRLPEDYAVTAEVTCLDPATMEVKTQTETLTLADDPVITYWPGNSGVTISWRNVLKLPNWVYRTTDSGITFDPKYTTTVKVTESKYAVDGYTCTQDLGSGATAPMNGQPYTKTESFGVYTQSGTLAQRSVILNNRYEDAALRQLVLSPQMYEYDVWTPLPSEKYPIELYYEYSYEYNGVAYSGKTTPECIMPGVYGSNQVLPIRVNPDGTTPTNVTLTLKSHEIDGYEFYCQVFDNNGWQWVYSDTVTLPVTGTKVNSPVFMFNYYKKTAQEKPSETVMRETNIVVGFQRDGIVPVALDDVDPNYTITYSYTTAEGEVVSKVLTRETAGTLEIKNTLDSSIQPYLTWTIEVPVTEDGVDLTLTQENYGIAFDSYVWQETYGVTEPGNDGSNIGVLHVSKDNNPVTAYVYNRYARQFTVSFDARGGTETASQTVPDGGRAVEPAAPTREGYTFKGWTLDGEDYDFGTPVTRDITLAALWSENSSNPDPVIPDPVVYTYVLTVNYVDGNGDIVATAYTAQMPAGAAYSVSSPAVEGYTPDQTVVSGTMPAGNVTVTVVYAADEADIEDENPPLAELPDPGEDIPDADLPKETEEVPVDDEEDITDEDVPLSDVPKTGDHTNRFLVMAAVSGLCLLTLLSGRRKEDEA